MTIGEYAIVINQAPIALSAMLLMSKGLVTAISGVVYVCVGSVAIGYLAPKPSPKGGEVN
jgi:hypothetical protein